MTDPAARCRALLAAEREKEKSSHLSGWGSDTIPVEVELQEDETRLRPYRESIELMHWRGDLSDYYAWRDAALYVNVKRPMEPTRAKE